MIRDFSTCMSRMVCGMPPTPRPDSLKPPKGILLYGPGVTVRFLGSDNTLLEDPSAMVLQIDIQCTHDLESEIARLTLERVEENFTEWARAFEVETDADNDATDFWELDEFQDT